MNVDFSELSAGQIYQTMTQLVIPRPIAWVLTDNGHEEGGQSYNLAPYSYFTPVSSNPPLLMISVGNKPGGEVKDTRKNLLERGLSVFHIASAEQADLVNESARDLAHGESEIGHLDIELTDEPGWPLPRLANARVAMLCSFHEQVEVGENKQGLMFCRIEKVWVDDEAVTQDYKNRTKYDASIIDPLARLGASEYADIAKPFSIVRPA